MQVSCLESTGLLVGGAGAPFDGWEILAVSHIWENLEQVLEMETPFTLYIIMLWLDSSAIKTKK